MQIRSLTSNLGVYAFAGSAIFLGVLGLATGDFATQWQNVGPNVPMREPLAYLTALIELAAGLALLWPRTARAGALALTVVFAVFTLLWAPKLFGSLSSFDGPGNFFEEFSILAGADCSVGAVLIGGLGDLAPRITLRAPFRSFGNLIRHCSHLRYARVADLDSGVPSAFADVLGLRDDHRLFRRSRGHSFGLHGSAGFSLADRGNRQLRNICLASQADRQPA